jgi:predicted GIY-YIG superfamily endonuclease
VCIYEPLGRGNEEAVAQGYAYIMFNNRRGTLYVGVTSDLVRRVFEHKEKAVDGFTQQYGLDKLGYYEQHPTIVNAILREKQIKAGSRVKKIALIEGLNPKWQDLYDNIVS